MTYRLASERVTVTAEDGPSIEVERVAAWSLYWTALALAAAALDGENRPGAQYDALRTLGLYFIAEAQPSWDIVDHRGPVPATVEGFLRLPGLLPIQLVNGWIETHVEKASAVDATIPPGPARDELNRRLKAAKAA